MARYGWGGDQWFDDNGDPLSGGLLFFYEPGTETDKTTFSDDAETIPNSNPVVLDAAGRQPNVFFTGEAKIRVTDADGVQIDVSDPVGSASNVAPLATWSSDVTYGSKALVTGSNGLNYRSIISSNIGNDPISSPMYWMEVRFLNVYNANYSYVLGDVALSGQSLWLSLDSSNTGNTPATSPTKWRPLNTDVVTDFTPRTAAFTAGAGTNYLIDTDTVGSFAMTLPATPTVGDSVGITDITGSWVVNPFTVGRNGERVMNDASDMVCDISYFSGVLVYTGSTYGWVFI